MNLASSVSGAGALGALALTWTAADKAVEHVLEMRARTAAPFQVNYVLAIPPNSLDRVLDAGAPVVTFSWGDATEFIPRVKAAGARAGVQVVSIGGAVAARDAGADFLVCQGVEAGGHVQSSRPLSEVLEEIATSADMVPLIAAGGISNGADIARVFAMGAAGAMLGTRFVATAESLAHTAYKNALIEASSAASVLTVCFDGGWPYAAHRVLRNRTLDRWESAGSPPPGSRPDEGEILAVATDQRSIRRYDDTMPLQSMRGRVEEMALYAGIGCGSITEIPPVGGLVNRLWQEYCAAANK